MPPSYPPHPGHQIGHSLLVVLGPWRWPVADSGNWALPSDNRRVLVHGAVVALLWPTESIVRVQPKVGWDTLPASSCRPFRIPSFHELEYLFKLTRASERRPSVLMYPCTTSAHPLPLRVGCNLPAYQRVSTLLPHAAMFISNSEARGRFFFSPAAHYSTSSPVDMGLATVFFFSLRAPLTILGEVGCRIPILVPEHICQRSLLPRCPPSHPETTKCIRSPGLCVRVLPCIVTTVVSPRSGSVSIFAPILLPHLALHHIGCLLSYTITSSTGGTAC
ncbi:hypothetical protein F5883DRAFT_86185 [Diaporthe sp. PMI_573]|nr:hypothetical protein F5883DRAFT_86185 [Diaporthaceae sp. PMI_573]